MENHDYYTHSEVSRYHHYSGRLGALRKVSRSRHYAARESGYQTFMAPLGTPLTEVLVMAAIAQGAHHASYRVEKIREHGDDVH